MEPGRYTRHRSSTYTRAGLLHYIQDLLSPLCQRSKWPRKSRTTPYVTGCVYIFHAEHRFSPVTLKKKKMKEAKKARKIRLSMIERFPGLN